MWYDVESNIFELTNISPEEKNKLEECSWLESKSASQYKIKLHGEESFWYQDYENILKKATTLNKVRVNFSDHKGANSFDLIFGQGQFKD